MVGPTTSVTCTFPFEAAHHLPWHSGKCRNPHGHSYRLEVTVSGPLDEHGVVLDFDVLHEVVNSLIIDAWDHHDLNDLFANPTAEHLAHEAWRILAAAGLDLGEIRLWETADSFVTLRAGS